MIQTLKHANRMLALFGFFKVPLIWYCRPKILVLDEKQVQVKITLRRRTKNHLNSMYFGTLAIGADLAGGFMAMTKAESRGHEISLAFKAVTAEFLKRPEADVVFTCVDGKSIDEMLDETIKTGLRVNRIVRITATCPELHKDEPVAVFDLTLSVKAMHSA